MFRLAKFHFIISQILLIPLISDCSEHCTSSKLHSPIVGKQCMVSTAHPLATDAGIRILKTGGNAFDAAVGIAATLNVVEPMMSGMGGYGTILIYDATKNQVRFLDSSGKIPLNVDSDVFRAPTPKYEENRRGAKAISTPGNVNAWEAMSKEYGKVPWKNVFETAIDLAENGFPVTKRLEIMLEQAFEGFPDHAKEFYGKDGRPLKEGELLIQQDLAKSLKLVAAQGSHVFYKGELAQKIHNEMRMRDSFLTIDDLIADRAEWWKPIMINYKGYQVYTASPPSTAFPSLIRLGMMSCLDSLKLKHNSVEYLHYFAEITKHAFWCRLKYAGDPEIEPPPLDMLLSKKYWQAQIDKIDPCSATTFVPPGKVPESSQNTTHFVVADQWGNIVSATQTLGYLFGSRIMPEGTGIWFNNSLEYCTFEPKGNPMDAKAGQRKLSGDCPTIIFKDERPWAALGTPGGHTIGQTVPQMVMNLIDFKMNILEAISAPRASFVEPNILYLDKMTTETVFEKLKKFGHNARQARALGNAHGLRIFYDSTGKFMHFEGAADPRGEGTAEGF